jgi:hypothetical protein
MKAKLGRPPLEVTRDVLIGARFTADEATLIERAVAASRQNKSDWIRTFLLAAADAPKRRPVPSPVAAVALEINEEFLD